MKLIFDTAEEIPEAIREEFEERDGKFHLKIDGDVPGFVPSSQVNDANRRVTEFRDNNIRLLKAIGASSFEEAVSTIDQLKAIDPKEVETLKEKLAEFEKKGIKDPNKDVLALVSKAVSDAVSPLQRQLTELGEREKKANRDLKVANLKSSIVAVASKAGVEDTALTDFTSRALGVFNEEGIAMDGETPLFSAKDPSKPLSIDEFAERLKTEAPHLFKANKGGGASPAGVGNGGIKPGVKKLVNPSPQQLGQYSKEIAEGKVVIATE